MHIFIQTINTIIFNPKQFSTMPSPSQPDKPSMCQLFWKQVLYISYHKEDISLTEIKVVGDARVSYNIACINIFILLIYFHIAATRKVMQD